MGPPEVKSVAEHSDLLLWLLVVVVGAILAELRYAIRNIFKEQKRFIQLHSECQKSLPERFLALDQYKEDRAEVKKNSNTLAEDREKRWSRWFWTHTHRADDGSVKVPNPE